MRNQKWLRYSLASLTLVGAGLGALLVACGDDDNTVTAKDAGTAETSTTGDSAANDATADHQTPPKKAPAKLQLANAASDMGPNNTSGLLRFCYAIAPGVFAPLPPIPDLAAPGYPIPGVPIGTGGAAAGTGADLSTLSITPYLMNAETLAARGIVRGDAGSGPSCGDILAPTADAGGQGPLVDGVDFWKLETIPAGTLLADKSFVLVLTGCASDSTAGAAKCGPDFTPTGAPGNGNLKTTVYELDRATAIAADKIGTQFIHASPSGATVLAAAGGVIPGYYGADAGGTFRPVMADGGAVALHALAPLNQIQGVAAASDTFTANPNVPGLAIPLPKVELLTYGGPAPDGGAFRNGAAFTFIALGDPTADPDAGGNFNTKTFHYIALPNDPAVSTYK